MFAPTKAVWSADNRTAGFRVCGEHTKAVRVECRIPGSDVNPYLACAALLAAGSGRDREEDGAGTGTFGRHVFAKGIREIPHNLREAADLLNGSKMLREAFGDDVIDHYHHAASGRFRRPTAS
jgi:glutamine synthetase